MNDHEIYVFLFIFFVVVVANMSISAGTWFLSLNFNKATWIIYDGWWNRKEKQLCVCFFSTQIRDYLDEKYLCLWRVVTIISVRFITWSWYNLHNCCYVRQFHYLREYVGFPKYDSEIPSADWIIGWESLIEINWTMESFSNWKLQNTLHEQHREVWGGVA